MRTIRGAYDSGVSARQESVKPAASAVFLSESCNLGSRFLVNALSSAMTRRLDQLRLTGSSRTAVWQARRGCYLGRYTHRDRQSRRYMTYRLTLSPRPRRPRRVLKSKCLSDRGPFAPAIAEGTEAPATV